jgi:hypothetical protein
VVGVADDPRATAAAWARIPGVEVEGGALRMGAQRLEFVEPAGFEKAFGPPPTARPCLAALVFAVSDLARTQAALDAGRAARRSVEGALQATSEGVVFRFEKA